jgi:hypothetical protein
MTVPRLTPEIIKEVKADYSNVSAFLEAEGADRFSITDLTDLDRSLGIVGAGTAYNSYFTDNEGRQLNPETGKVEDDTKSDALCLGVDESVDFREIVKLYKKEVWVGLEKMMEKAAKKALAKRDRRG